MPDAKPAGGAAWRDSAPGDAKESLFRDYLEDRLTIFELGDRLSAGAQDAKGRGAFYTPPAVAEFMVGISGVRAFDIILDPSVGHGAFVFALLDHAREAWGLSGQGLLEWFLTKVSAVDLSEQSVRECAELVRLYFRKLGVDAESVPLDNLVCADALFHDYGKRFSLCIGNPPYIRRQNMEEDYVARLRTRFSTCAKGNIDIYYAFIERAMELADRVTLITPNGFLSNASGRALKALVMPRLHEMVDFRERRVFPGVSTYTCIVRVGEPTDRYRYRERMDAQSEERDKTDASSRREGGHRVLAGVATLRDKVFTVERDGDRFFASLDGVRHEVEAGIVVPFLKITRLDAPLRFMIFPYARDRSIIPAGEMSRRFPKAWSYLQAARPELDRRDKGKTERYEAWYAYGRKQGIHDIGTDTALAIPQMIGGKCRPRIIDLAAMMRKYGRVLFVSGYLVPVEPQSRRVVDFVLSPAFDDWLRHVGKPWPGKDESYYSIGIRQIREL